jgi:CTP:molybdopterin cytidylyltransferase MocA
MKRAKALLPWKQSTFVREIARTFSEAGLSPIVVVVGPTQDGQAIKREVAGLALCAVNPTPERGMSSSLLVGAQALLARGVNAALVTPVDQPQISVGLCQKLCEALEEGHWAVASHQGKWGHPYAALDLSALASLTEAQTAQEILQRNTPLAVEAGPEVLFNINTPEDYQEALSRLTKEPQDG